MKVDVKTYLNLKDQPRKIDNRKPAQLEVRVAWGNEKERFNIYLKDRGESVYLWDRERSGNSVIDHERSMRYNYLLQFTRTKLSEIMDRHFQTRTILNRDLVRQELTEITAQDFEYEFASTVRQQTIDVPLSGYNNFKRLTVDPRALDEAVRTVTSAQATVDPEGNVELNDYDAGDIEMVALDIDNELQVEAQDIRDKMLTTPERYRRGKFNRKNILQLFASIYYDKVNSVTYDKIVIRLFQFWQHEKPPLDTSTFNDVWVTNFFRYLWNIGYCDVSTINFDPLNFNANMFDGKTFKKYDADNYYKMFEILQTVSNKFAKSGLLDPIDFTKINLFEICGVKKKSKGKHKKENLKYRELNDLFFFKFQPSRLAEYQQIFQTKYDKKILITISDLETARDMFCLQTMAGGIRGYRDLQTLEFIPKDNALSFYVMKLKCRMLNPLNVYTEKIALDHGNQLPRLRFKNSENTKEHIYRALLKTIAEIVNFDRKIVNGSELRPVKDFFNARFARKTFSQIMWAHFGIDKSEIAMFTGHSLEMEGGVLSTNYLDEEDEEMKAKTFRTITFPEGFGMETCRTETVT